MSQSVRRLLPLLVAIFVTSSLVAGCDGDEAASSTSNVSLATPTGVQTASASGAQVAASHFLFDSAKAVVLADPADGEALRVAREFSIPVLPATAAGKAEAKRLGAKVVDLDQVEVSELEPPTRKSSAVIATVAAPSPELKFLAELGGAKLILTTKDPRTDAASIKALQRTKKSPLLAVGAKKYPVEAVRAEATVPAGGYLALPGHRYLALYGHPQTAALGILGEQSPRKSVKRVQNLVRKYEAAAPNQSFAPAFEIIATVASAGPGKRRDYSRRTPVAELRPLIDEAKAAGVTVILDLQPGRGKALAQAKEYRSLLLEPHVGLAVDPEWKLGPKGKPLQRIGHMTAAEINSVTAWLAELTVRHTLPQKLFVVHQFQTQMVRNRSKLVTNRPELAMVIHVDGQGAPAAKHNTWHNIRADAPAGVFWGWKNFLDEDQPMLTVPQTWQKVRPHPDLITYQ